MTSEGMHHPGQEPDEVSPGAGGPAPQSDRAAQSEQGGYDSRPAGGAPDLGWAPPPPTNRPQPSGPEWGGGADQQGAPGWGAPGARQGGSGWDDDRPAAAGWGAPPPSTPAPPDHPAWSPPASPAAGPHQPDPGHGGAAGWDPAPPPGAPAAPAPWGAREAAAAPVRASASVPTGTASVPGASVPGGGGFPSGSASVPTGSASVATGSASVASGSASVPTGSASVSGGGAFGAADDGPAGWGGAPAGAPAGPPRWPGGAGNDLPERPVVPEVEPWSPGEVWGAAEASVQQADPATKAWEPPARPEENEPAYQPAPGPGISPANAVPLPPQEQRIPGASLAAAPPPAGYVPPAQYAPPHDYAQPAYGEPAGGDPGLPQPAPEPDQSGWGGDSHGRGDQPGWGTDGRPAEQSGWSPEPYPAAEQPPTGTPVPRPRTSGESIAPGRASVPVPDQVAAAAPASGAPASGSASVPLASRVMPPTDQALRPSSLPTAQPRVYGRPVQPEPAQEEEQPQPDQPQGWDQAPARTPEWNDDRGSDRDQGWGQGQASGQDWDRGQTPGQDWDREADQGWNRADQGSGHASPGFASESRFDGPDQHTSRPGDYSEPTGTFAPSAPAVPPPFPPGVPSFADPAGQNRPVNGHKPHSGTARPGQPEGFGGPIPSASGAASVGGTMTPGYGSTAPDSTTHFPADAPGGFGDGPGGYPPGQPGGGFGDPPGGYPPGQPGGFGDPPGQPGGFPGAQQPDNQPAWNPMDGPDQGRFDAFKPDAEPKPKPETASEPAPTPKVRNGRVLLAVLLAAVLILAVPLGLLWLLGKTGGEETPAFNPAVGSCVKQSGESAVAAPCEDAAAFKVISKVDAKEKCADPALPHIVLPGDGATQVLCLQKPAAG